MLGASSNRNRSDGDSHYRLANSGKVHTIHIFYGSAADRTGGVFIPEAFSLVSYEGGGIVSATNPSTHEVIGAAHIDVNSQAEVDRNMRTTNRFGSRLIGNIGGLGGEGGGDIHAHLSIYPNAKARRMARSYKGDQSVKLKDYDSSISRWLGDFRRLIR